jgi:hypothetical protein
VKVSRISIVIPLYNKGKYITETICSVLVQELKDLEIIVVDNGSTDDGATIVRGLVQSEPRVRLLQSPGCGPGHARNYGVAQATGSWILFLDADDLIEPSHLSSLLDISERNPERSIIAGGWKEFVDGESGRMVEKSPAGRDDRTNLINGAVASSPWAVHAAIVKRELALQCPWPEEMDGMLAEDNVFWFQLCLSGTVAYSESNGALYRTQTANCRTQSHDIEKWFCGVHEAVRRNVAALEVRKLNPNAEQCEALMRLYSELYRQAVEGNAVEFKRRALHEAQRWLSAGQQTGHRISMSMTVRRLLGIGMFERTKRVLGK